MINEHLAKMCNGKRDKYGICVGHNKYGVCEYVARINKPKGCPLTQNEYSALPTEKYEVKQ